MGPLPGSHLLAALHASMERIKTVLRICRAAAKPPQLRSNTDVSHIMGELQGVPLLSRDGPEVLRDLCHVVQMLSLNQMATLRLTGDSKSGALLYVLQGRVQVRTKGSTAGFQRLPGADANSSSGSSAGGGSVPAAAGADAATAGSVATTEQELRALFDSIDKDGSGAIDVEELQFALSVMGVAKSPEEVQELMDSVDKDGSGQLDFGEFTLILRTRLGVGGGGSGGLVWTELADGSSSCELGPGGVLGEAALAGGLLLDGLVVAQDDSHLLLLEPAAYAAILADGFDGQLNAKAAVLKACPALAACLARSDVRALAYAAVSQRLGWGEQLYGAAGAAADALFVIQEGSCRVIVRSLVQVQDSSASRVAAAAEAHLAADAAAAAGQPCSKAVNAAAALMASPRQGLHSSRCSTVVRKIDLAVLGPGDLAGEAALLGPAAGKAGSTTVVVSSSQLVVLKLLQQQVKQLMHPADFQRLCEYLQQREEQRRQRLVSGQIAAGAVARAQQQLKAATTAADVAVSLAGPVNGNEPATVAGRICRSAAAGGSSAAGAAASAAAAAGLQLPVLPSSAAAASAAIATAGGCSHRDLPSKIQQRKVDAVSQLLHDLVMSREHAEAENSAAGVAAVVAMAAAQTAAATAAVAAAAVAEAASNRALSAASAAFSGTSSGSRQKPRSDSLAPGCSSSSSNPGAQLDSGSIAAGAASSSSKVARAAAMGVGVQGNLPCARVASPCCSSHGAAAADAAAGGEGVALAGLGMRLRSLVMTPRASAEPCSSASGNGWQQLLSTGNAGQPVPACDGDDGSCSRSYRHKRVFRQPPATTTAAGSTAGGGHGCCCRAPHDSDTACCAGGCCTSSGGSPCSSHGSGVKQHSSSSGEAAGRGSTAPSSSGCRAVSSPGRNCGSSAAGGQLRQQQQLDHGASSSGSGSSSGPWPSPAAAAVVGWRPGATPRRHHHRRQQQPSKPPATAPAAAAYLGLTGQHLGGTSCVAQDGGSSCTAASVADDFFLTAAPEAQPPLFLSAAVSAAQQSLPTNSIRLLTPRQQSPPRGPAGSSRSCCSSNAGGSSALPGRLSQQRAPAVVSMELQQAGPSDTARKGIAGSYRHLVASVAAQAASAAGGGGWPRNAPRNAALRGSTCSSLCSGGGSSARPVAGGLFTPLDAGIRQAAEAAAESTSWSLGMQLLLQAQLQQQPADDRQHVTHVDPSSSSRCASLNGNRPQQQQQQQTRKAKDRPDAPACGGRGSTSQAGVSGRSAALLPPDEPSSMPTSGPAMVPRLQLSKLQLVPPQLTALASNTHKQSGRSTTQRQQQQLDAIGGVAACADASAGVPLLPAALPGWRSALTTRWTAGGRFGIATTTGVQAVAQAACTGSKSSRL